MIIICNFEILLLLCIIEKCLDRLFSVGSEILFGDLYADLLAFDRLSKSFDNRIKRLALAAELSHFNNDLCNKICAVIKEIIFPHCRMTRSLDSKGAVHTLFILSDSLIDNILIAPLEAQMLSAECILYECL